MAFKKERQSRKDCLSYDVTGSLNSNFMNMPTNLAKKESTKYLAGEVQAATDNEPLVQEHEEVESTVPNSTTVNDEEINVPPPQKLPHFFEHKIRMRKYDFL